jgi:two-component system response regulator AtoC
VNILIVEDEHALRQPIVKMLRNEGFSVTEADDGTEALEVIRSQTTPVDLLLLDIALPGVSSREVLAEARRLFPGIPVIVTSAFGREQAGALLAADIDHFVQKPYQFRHILDAIREVVP